MPRPSRADAALAASLAVIDILGFALLVPDEWSPAVGGYGLAAYVALAARRTAPWPVLLLMCAHLLLAAVVVPGYEPVFTVPVAMYTVALLTGRLSAWGGLALASAAMTAGILVADRQDPPLDVPLVSVSVGVTLITLVGVWALGRWVRRSRRQISRLELRRRLAAAEAVAAERARVARELHDIVSHSVSVMVLQAAGGRRVLDRQPERTAECLERIEAVGKQSMVELRRLLGVLRDSEADPSDLTPQRALDDIPALVTAFRDGGMEVALTTRGTPVPLDASVSLAVYRVVQEALTNSLKHAGPDSRTAVGLSWLGPTLVVEVTDDGAGVPPGAPGGPVSDLSSGYGLIGLRERVRAIGGALDSGPLAGGGFRVTASLPVATVPAAVAPQDSAGGLRTVNR